MRIWTWIERVLSSLVALAAVILAVAFSFQVRQPPTTSPTPPLLSGEERYVEDWEADAEEGIRLGPKGAKVTIMEFMDFECPFCARTAAVIDSLRMEYPREVTVVFQHFPLERHPLSRPAAIAAECADAQGGFETFYHLLFLKQDSLGKKDWTAYARDSGVRDLREFERCLDSPGPRPRIDAGKALGIRMGVKGTPTVLVEGWIQPRPPTLQELLTQVEEVLGNGSGIH